MRELAAYSTTLVTLSLVVTRPQLVWRRWPFARSPHRRSPHGAAAAADAGETADGHTARLSPAIAMFLGVTVLYLAGFGSAAQLAFASSTMWRPLLTIASMLVLTDEIARAGVLQTLATEIDRRAHTTTALFTWVYWSSAAIAALLSNDAAILVMTPLVLGMVRARFSQSTPTQAARIVWPFALAVFMAAGIAPLPTSNPMNLVMTQMAGISAGHYVLRMGPVALAACAATYLLLRVMFLSTLRAADRDASRCGLQSLPETQPQPVRARFTHTQSYLIALLLLVLTSVAFAPVIGLPTWAIALTGAALAKMVSLAAPNAQQPESRATGNADRPPRPTPRISAARSRWQQLAAAMALETLAFVFLALLLAQALAAAGLLTRLTAAYQHASVATIATYSAFGSALINNHPMSQLNMLALADHASANSIFAALIGGDLGPRMLPIGSLAGMLWVAQLRKYDVAFSLRDFVKVGVLLAGVTIALAILLLG